MKRSLALAALPLILSGCLPLPLSIASTAISGMSYLASGKSTSDHALSAVADQDCALTRPLIGEPFCREVGPNGEGETQIVTVGHYPGDRDGGLSGQERRAALREGAAVFATDAPLSEQAVWTSSFVGAPPKVSIAGIVVTKDRLLPAPDALPTAAPANGSWASVEPAVSSKAAPEASAPGAGDRWVILGSFKGMERARVMADRYADRTPSILEATVDGRAWLRVAVGPLTSAEARRLRDDLGAVDGRLPWVVRLEAPTRVASY